MNLFYYNHVNKLVTHDKQLLVVEGVWVIVVKRFGAGNVFKYIYIYTYIYYIKKKNNRGKWKSRPTDKYNNIVYTR